jgi:ketosteroid isomerase-like protein
MPGPGVSIEAIGRQFVDAFNRRDVSDLIVLTDPAVEFHPTSLVGERRRYDGHEGLRRWFADLEESQIEHQVRVKEVRQTDEGFLVLSEVLLGGELVSPSAMLAWVNDDGLIVEARAFLTDPETLRQVGWVPDDAE